MSAPDRHLGDAPGHWASRLLGRSFLDTASLKHAPSGRSVVYRSRQRYSGPRASTTCHPTVDR